MRAPVSVFVKCQKVHVSKSHCTRLVLFDTSSLDVTATLGVSVRQVITLP